VIGILGELSDISGWVTNRNGSIRASSDIILHIALHCSHVRRVLIDGLQVVDDLVASKETQQIGIALEGFNDCENMLHVVASVCAPRIAAINVLSIQGSVDVKNNIDSHTIEDWHTFIVVEGLEIDQLRSYRGYRGWPTGSTL
jgi:hypothetical protein